jgi:hypothetical protein
MTDEPWAFDGPPAEITEYEKTYVARRQAKPKRPGATPEAKVAKAIDSYLEQLDFYVLRTSAGMAQIGDRKMSMGRVGTHDRTCCAPNGRFVSIEIKSAAGSPSDAQLRQKGFIQRRNGIVIIPHSVAELRAGLVDAFGAQTVADWEKLGKKR